MKTTLRNALIAMIFSLPAWAEAAVWSAVISDGKMRADIDVASITRQGNIVTAWEREVYSGLEQAQPGDFYFKSSKALFRYGCDVRTADMLMKVYYAEDGSEIKVITASNSGRPNFVIPDTHVEQKFDYACKYRKSPEKKAAAVVRKKVSRPKEADKAVPAPAKKEAPAVKAKPMPEAPPVTPPRSVPIRKPSALLPRP